MAEGVLTDPDPSLIGKRASRGVIFLLLRHGGVQITALAANIALSRLLSPTAFGIYAITLFVLVALSFLGDFGLGPALLQKRASVTESDLRTVFTVQQAVVGALAISVTLASPWLASAYHLGPDGVWYFRAIAMGGLLVSLKTVPTIVIERQLLYGRLALVDVAEVMLFQGTAVLLATQHFGAWSFIWAVVVSKAAGCLLSYVVSGWRPALAFAQPVFRSLWAFAAPFQLTWITYIFRDYLIPILGGLLVSTAEVGYLNWALALAGVPGQMAQIVGRVAFPSFARLQADPRLLRRAIEASIRALFLVAVPVQLALITLAPYLIDLVFSPKWRPALIPLYLLCVHWAGANLTSPLAAALNAIGRPRAVMALNVAWTVATIALAVVFVHWMGYIGIPVAYATTRVGAATAFVLMIARTIPIRLWPQVRVPLAAGLAVASGGYLATQLLPITVPTLLIVVAAMGVAYTGLLWLTDGGRLRADVGDLIAFGQRAPAK